MTAREQRLGLIFGVVVIGVGIYFADDFLRQRIGTLRDEVRTLEADQRDSQVLLGDEVDLRGKREWLEQRLGAALSVGDAQADLQEKVVTAATGNGIVIVDQQLLPPTGVGDWARARVKLSLSGNEERLLRLISRLRDRDRLQAVESFTLSPSEDHTALRAEIIVQRLFLPTEPVATPSES